MTAMPVSWKDFVAFFRSFTGEKRPFITYGRDAMWHGEPCLICGSNKGIGEVKGRYLVGGDPDNEFIPIAHICGNCITILENDMEAMFE